MTRTKHYFRIAALAALPVLLLAGAAPAQDRSSGGFLDNLFRRGEPNQPQGQSQVEVTQGGRTAQADPAELTVRLDRMESALRQLTGTIEQLQYRNQQLEMQLKRLQDDTDYRLQQLGSKGGATPAAPLNAPPAVQPGRRGDVFDPSQRPNAPGAPRTLGHEAVLAAPVQNQTNEQTIGAPGGRAAGAPLDLNALSGNQSLPPPVVRDNVDTVQASQPASQPVVQPAQQLPPVMTPRQVTAPTPQLATLPPTASPQDEYDLAYGYVLRKDYALAEQTFRDFLRKFPNERLVPDAQYWLGESLFQRQRYRDAAESFLAVSTKFEKSGKAPDSLLRLGQSLAALKQKEAACATLAEVGRKFPRASASVKRGVAQELKRVHC
jgi:tol-pal system protein YbgF